MQLQYRHYKVYIPLPPFARIALLGTMNTESHPHERRTSPRGTVEVLPFQFVLGCYQARKKTLADKSDKLSPLQLAQRSQLDRHYKRALQGYL